MKSARARGSFSAPAPLVGAAALAFSSLACGSPAPGTVDIRVYGESFIEEGIPAEAFSDGWALVFDQFLVSVSEVAVAAGHGEPAFRDVGQRIVDLAKPSMEKGVALATATLGGGRYDHFGYRISPARSGAIAGNALAPGALERMIAAGASIQVSGRATRSGQTVRFDWSFDRTTDHGCHVDLDVDGHTAPAQITIHGDHLFFDDLVSSEPNLAFDLYAASDANGDGTLTRAELGARDIRGQARYQVGNVPARDLWSFIAHQGTTVGHINGEGHCETSSD